MSCFVWSIQCQPTDFSNAPWPKKSRVFPTRAEAIGGSTSLPPFSFRILLCLSVSLSTAKFSTGAN